MKVQSFLVLLDMNYPGISLPTRHVPQPEVFSLVKNSEFKLHQTCLGNQII